MEVQENFNVTPGAHPSKLVHSFPGERWRRIHFAGFDQQPEYYVSNHGRITNRSRIIAGSTINGYKSLNLRVTDVASEKYGVPVAMYVHKLVAKYFVAKAREDQSIVIHMDFDKRNNFHENLRHVSKAESVDHLRDNPSYQNRVWPKRLKNHKLTEAKVRIIKTLLKNESMRLNLIAKQFGVTHTQINRIRSGENWKHVTV